MVSSEMLRVHFDEASILVDSLHCELLHMSKAHCPVPSLPDAA